MTSLLLILGGIVFGLVVMYVVSRPTISRFANEVAASKDELNAKSDHIISLSREVAQLAAERASLEEKLALHKEELVTVQERQRIDFKNLANDILEEKSRQFKQSNKESLEILLKPFKDNIEGFRKRVEEVYDKEAQQRFSLKEEIKNLSEMNRKMSEETSNLTSALKGNSKVQGDWGEMILETILDNSNLIKGVHYRTQESLKDDTGATQRPDVILDLPDSKQIIIDSKVSLTAFVGYSESESAEDRSRFIKDHIRSVRSHIDELGSKRYQALVESPDFVIMFVPNEPAFLLALQNDNTLWSDAYNKKVIVSSPTNLFALLKIVDDLWRRDNQSKNAITIATEGANLYDKFVGFAETLADLGKNLDSTNKSYEKALNQLKTGKGNLVTRAEKLRELGVKATKSLPSQMSDYDE